MSAFLADLPYLAVAVLVVAAVARTSRDIREERREAKRRAVARHPSRRAVPQPRRRVPGLCPDGEPLNKEDLQKYLDLMFRAAGERGDQARDNSADEGA